MAIILDGKETAKKTRENSSIASKKNVGSTR